MRVGRPAALHRFDRSDERGAIAVLMAISMTVVIGGAALALDVGNAWQEQRRLHVATDAAALASAQEYALRGYGCAGSVAGAYVSSNAADATMTSCAGNEISTTRGYTTVGAAASIEYQFAKVFGLSNKEVRSKTSAGWGIPAAATGLRPIVVCLYFPDLAAWLAAGPTAPSGPITIPYTNGSAGCGNAPGNWTLLDYDASAGGASELTDYLVNGFQESIVVPGMLSPQTGQVASINNALSQLVSAGTVFPIPLFDVVVGQGNTAQYHAVGVAMVKLLDFTVNGQPSGQYFTFQFMPGIVEGTCCGTGPDTGARAVYICAMNTDPAAGKCGL